MLLDESYSTIQNPPLISIITVVFNGEKYLEETIQSVINQTYENVEYIIIDGGSTDGTIDIIRKYEGMIDYWVSERDYGLYHAMNKGIEKATGDIIGIINADDYYLDGAFEKVARVYLPKLYDTHIFTADIYYGDRLVAGWRQKDITNENFMPHPPMFVSRTIYNKIGVYLLQYKISSDYDFMYRAFNVYGIKPLYLSEPVAFFRPCGLSSQSFFRNTTEYMLVKVSNGQNVSKAFIYYLLKLLKFNIMKLFKRV